MIGRNPADFRSDSPRYLNMHLAINIDFNGTTHMLKIKHVLKCLAELELYSGHSKHVPIKSL